MGDEKNFRHRFTVPKGDDKVEEWILAQSNLGFSLRVLIRAFVRSYGIRDATCMELGTPVKRVGRPPNQAKIALGQMTEDMDSMVPEEAEQPIAPARPQPQSQREQPAQASRPVPQQAPANSLEAMLGMPQPSTAGQSLMDGIMNLDD